MSLCLGGIPEDHLIVPVSGHSVPNPMHLKLGQKDKVWTGKYVKEEDGIGINALVDDEEENNLEEDDEEDFECWGNDEEEEEEEGEEEGEGDEAEVEWEVPDFVSQSSQHPQSQQHHHYGPHRKKEEGGDVGVEDTESQAVAGAAVRSQFSRYRALRRLRRWRRLQSHSGLGFRLTQHWKNWRQRAQWVGTLGHRWTRKGQRNDLYAKQRRVKGYWRSPYDAEEEDDDNDEGFMESESAGKFSHVHLHISRMCFNSSSLVGQPISAKHMEYEKTIV